MRAFPVRMPSGVQYWTVIDSDLRVVPAADAYLRHLRFGRDAADSTTKAYAGAVVLYLSWCAATGQDWRLAVERLPSFVLCFGTRRRRPGPRPARRCAGRGGSTAFLLGREGFWPSLLIVVMPGRTCSANSTSWRTVEIFRRRRAARTGPGGCG